MRLVTNGRAGRPGKKAVFTRFQKCTEWLRRLCTAICRNNKVLGAVPGRLEGKNVCAVDAGDGPVRGSGKADYRLHYAVGLFDLGMKEMALTSADC